MHDISSGSENLQLDNEHASFRSAAPVFAPESRDMASSQNSPNNMNHLGFSGGHCGQLVPGRPMHEVSSGPDMRHDHVAQQLQHDILQDRGNHMGWLSAHVG